MIARWEKTQGAYVWDVPDAGRLYVRRMAKGSRKWVVLHNGTCLNFDRISHFPSADEAMAVAEVYARERLVP